MADKKTKGKVKAGGWNSQGQMYVLSRTRGNAPHLIGGNSQEQLTCDCIHYSFHSDCAHVEFAARFLEDPKMRPAVGTAQYRFYLSTYGDKRRKAIRVERRAADERAGAGRLEAIYS